MIEAVAADGGWKRWKIMVAAIVRHCRQCRSDRRRRSEQRQAMKRAQAPFGQATSAQTMAPAQPSLSLREL
jgi:hypothetical protein